MPPSQAAAAHVSVVDTPPCGPACDRYDAQILVCLPPFDLAGRQWQRVRCVVIEGVLRSRSGLPEFPHSRANPRANGETPAVSFAAKHPFDQDTSHPFPPQAGTALPTVRWP